MTTFQGILYSALHALTEIFPLGSAAIQSLVSQFTGWPRPPLALQGVMTSAIALSIALYFIHDWLSMTSSFIQVFIERKKPMTMDERMPFFLILTTTPVALVWFNFHEEIEAHLDSSPIVISMTLIAFGIMLGIADHLSRKNKNMYDWNIIDSLAIGVSQLALFIPGCGRSAATITGGLFRNYSREASAKYSMFASLPILLATARSQLHGFPLAGEFPISETSWLTLGTVFVVSLGTSLLAVGALVKQIQKNGMSQYIWLRILLGSAGIALTLLHPTS